MITSKDIWRSTSARFLPGAFVASIPLLAFVWPLLTGIPIMAADFALNYASAMAGYAAVLALGRQRLRRADVLDFRGIVTGLASALVTIWTLQRIPDPGNAETDILILLIAAALTLVCYLPVLRRNDKQMPTVAAGERIDTDEILPALEGPTKRAGAWRLVVGTISGVGLGLFATVTVIASVGVAVGGDTAWVGGVIALLFAAPIGMLGGAALGVIATHKLYAARPWPSGPPRGWLGHSRGATVGGIGMALASSLVLLPAALTVLGQISDLVGLLFPPLMILASLIIRVALLCLILSTFGLVAVVLDRWLYESQAT